MKNPTLILIPLIILAIICGVLLFSYWHQDDTVGPQIRGERERTDHVTQTVTKTSEQYKDSEETTPVETPEQVQREVNEIIEEPQVLQVPEPGAEDKEDSTEEPADPVAAAWTRLEYISQNPQEWGEFSSKATELMEQLTPMWRTKISGETEEVIVLLEELSKLHDPRSAEIFVHYLNGSWLWVRYVEAALIAIGPPSVPPLIHVLDQNSNFSNSFRRKRAAKLLGIIGSEYQQELGSAVEYVILPKLEELAMLDPDYYGVRVVASEAISHLSSYERDSTVASRIEEKRQRIDRVTATAVETNGQSQIPHAIEPMGENGESLPAPEEPANPVTAAWARLEYISQNPQEWGEFSPEAAELMVQLTPTWDFDAELGEGLAEDAFKLLKKLVSFQDPRSAEVIANYINEGFGLSNEAVIPIGLPLVPALIPLLDANTRFEGRLKSVKILGILGEKHRHELGGAVEHIILPKLELLAISDPSPIIQRRAHEAISRFSYLLPDDAAVTPEAIDREIIEDPQVLRTPEPSEEYGKSPPAPEKSADLVAAAWARLEYISQNPQEWSELSPEATELIAQLTPTRTISTEEEMEEVIVLLKKLGKLRDSRSAELIINYFLEVGLWEKPMKEALIAIGPPSVPLLIPLLEPDTQLLGKLIGAKLLGIIGSEHRQELDGAVEHIILPKLEKLVTSDPSPRVRWYASVAISRIHYRQQDNIVEPPEQNKGEITETIEQPEAPHTPEPTAADEEDLTGQPTDPVAAAWARLEYISQNLQEWGEFSPEATKLMEQLTPTWVMRSEGEGEEAIELLDQLTKLHDPRSAEIFVNYIRAGVGGRPMDAALIRIGPPSVLPLISLLTDNEGFLNREKAAELLGIIGFEYQEELGDVVEYILLPKLKELATSDPNLGVREVAGEAIARFSYQSSDNTVTAEPDEPADPVAAAWARLEYISQNPQEWGEFSPEAAELMAQLTPTWVFDEADGEGPAEDAMQLLVKLASFQDPRSAEVIANYINEGFGLSNEDVVPIGPPLVPALLPFLDTNASFEGKLMSVDILGILGEKHRHELGGAVEHIILPKLKQLAISDPSPVVQRCAHEAGARLR